MHRIDSAGHVNNLFVEKDIGNGIPGTIFDADWPNALQEEVIAVIEAAGIVLAKGQNTQLLQALGLLYNGHYDTLAAAIAAIDNISIGRVIDIKNVAKFDMVDAATVVENEWDIITADAGKSLVRRDGGSKYLELQGAGIGRNFMQQLNADRRDVYLLVQGDSTGNSTDEWVYLVGVELASLFASYTVKYYEWDTVTDDYAAAVTIAAGTGANTLHIYNGSIAGATAQYFTGALKPTVYAGNTFDLIINNYGHNQGTDSVLNRIDFRLTASVSQTIFDQPDAELVLTLQNIDTGFEDFSARQVQATKDVADRLGLGTIDVRSVFRYKQLTGVIGDWMSDSVHTNSVGSYIWTKIVLNALLNPYKTTATRLNPLANKRANPIGNGYFVNWSWSESTPFGWSLGNATVSKELAIRESFGWSVKAVGTSGAVGTFKIQLDDYLLLGNVKGITFLARVFTPSGNGTNHAGRVEIATDIGFVASSETPEVHDGWTWAMVYADGSILDAATTLKLSVYVGDSTDICYIDRVMMIEGRVPAAPKFFLDVLSDYYDPSNVGVLLTNAVTVTDDQVVMDSTSEAFPSFYINVFGLVPNNSYTMTWVATSTVSGTVLARAGLNDTGDTLATATPLTSGTITWRPTSSACSLQFSDSAGAEPFTIADITIQKD